MDSPIIKVCTHKKPDSQDIALPISKLLTIEQCPSQWRRYDLYLFRDDAVVFYVGQSHIAFDRVWAHLHGGFKERSVVGRFVLCNWPRSMRFVVELIHSQSARFDSVGNDLDAAERYLIEQLSPCFNEASNSRPTPLPGKYSPPSAKGRRPKALFRNNVVFSRHFDLGNELKITKLFLNDPQEHQADDAQRGSCLSVGA